MPHVPLVASNGVHEDAIRVLITGFGPFANYKENPSWLAVRELHNVLLETSSPAEPVTIEDQEVISDAKGSRPIHITALMVPVTYTAVLSTVPKVHARPPTLPPPANDDQSLSAFPMGPEPPADGYDFVLHVGAGGTGNLRVEKFGHKFGYDMLDVDNKYAPEVKRKDGKREEGNKEKLGIDAVELSERARAAIGIKDTALRGFGEGYELFAEELKTGIDVDGLVQELQNLGVDQLEASTNAGRYLCDFIYYCSLAEARRTRGAGSLSSGKATKVLFVHCPPVNEPLSTEYVTEALRRVVVSVCGQSS